MHERVKIETTRRVLTDWLSDAEGPPTIGHTGNTSRIDADIAWTMHVRSGGQRTRENFLATKRFV